MADRVLPSQTNPLLDEDNSPACKLSHRITRRAKSRSALHIADTSPPQTRSWSSDDA